MPLTFHKHLLFALSLLSGQAIAQVSAPASTTAVVAPAPAGGIKQSASAPFPKKDDGKFLAHHERFLARAKSGPIELLFLANRTRRTRRYRAKGYGVDDWYKQQS
jgi:hypothetical protein